MRAPAPALAALAVLIALTACSETEPGARAQAPAPAAGGEELSDATRERLRGIERALDQGRLDAAQVLLAQLGPAGGLDARLCRARAAFLGGDAVGALREVESARAEWPERAEVPATAAELYAALGRLEAAEDEIRAGLERDGETPAILRARAVALLARPGSAEAGLALLERALERDPQLPFTASLHRQALVLVGRARLAAGRTAEALQCARAALAIAEAAGDGWEARELLAEGLAAEGELTEAIAILEELRAAGRDPGASLALYHQRAATQSLVARDRAGAIEHWLRARELGVTGESLGFGAQALAEEAGAETGRGVEAYERGEFAAAEEHFRRALVLDPGSVEAANHLAAARFRGGDYAGAAELWRAVLERARERGLALPEPVHLNLARALKLAGRPGDARQVLLDQLGLDPQGEWAWETREMLAALDAEAPAPPAPPSGGASSDRH